jgi:uncharacterized protein (DUF305 family)
MSKTIMMATIAALAGATSFIAAPTSAQEMKGHDHSTMQMGSGDDSASTEAFKAANAKMHKGMAIAFSGDADLDFARGMIAHHQGAIDMAKVELEHGKDPAQRKLAEEIITAQEKEIAEMQTWLKTKGQ